MRSLAPRLPALGAVALACVAVASLYSTGSLEVARPAPVAAPAGVAGLADTSAPVALANGQTGYWLGEGGTLNIATPAAGRVWIGFRGRSRGAPRELRFAVPGSTPLRRRIGRRLSPHVVGPVHVERLLSLPLSVVPPAERGRSVQLSNLRVGEQPFAVFPAAGFHPDEFDRGEQFNWLQQDGRLVLVGPTGARRAWLRVRLASVGDARRVRVTAPGLERTLTVPAAGTEPLRATLGPIRLAAGRATVRLVALEPAERVSGDPRDLSVRVASAEGRRSAR